MDPENVEARLEAVLEQLKARREASKQALDEAWQTRPQDCDELLGRLAEAHARFVNFSEVSEKALPLLRSLARIERLRRDAMEQLDRLTSQAEESRQMKNGLGTNELETMSAIPPTVGENFDLSLLSDEQLRLIRDARKALSGDGPALPAEAGAAPAPAATPTAAPASPPEEPARPPPTTDVTLEELTESVQAAQAAAEAAAALSAAEASPPSSPPMEGPSAEEPEAPVGLPGDDELDAMFEEAVTGEESSEPPPAPEPASIPPATPVEAAPPPAPAPEEGGGAGAKDPLDELLTRAGFEG